MAIKFYTDEHVHPAVVNALRRRGVDVLTAQEADKLTVPDEKHLEFAAFQTRVVFTQETDFLRLHKSGVLTQVSFMLIKVPLEGRLFRDYCSFIRY